MSEQMIKVTAEDGHTFDAFRATPDGESKGGLVVLQEIFGMTEQLKNITRAWAADGYDTILPAMYDRIKPETVIAFDDMESAQGMMKQFDPDGVVSDIRAAAAAVDGGKGVSVMGFCWGGGAAARMASILDLTSIVSFYGTALSNNAANGANCAAQFHFGETDQHSPPEIIAELKQNIPAAECHVYDAGHAFANDARPDFYVEPAALSARERTVEFLDRVHGA
ncbi:MAG: dienelactone hydrolase family protein [Rhodospirillaceae bacterium]|jgi:carboxymethylenebutenolidase|nr:dienelactone hydrolase family protein [Rhodospirillaceae bacterium]MBT4588985.1 dienelactone hydrolase family protein [Rhodospirillaceae bacterium]MBT5941955.1 dienelactone hydrolase family protein [Rhodospirillaceae bacterium]MBT7268360.1 dienelactone hydrolase family protein [Rhodospirillaceae bacterium]